MNDFQTQILERAERFTKPISSGAPSGVDMTFDADFDTVKSEIDKLASLSGGVPNWHDVVEKSEAILADKSRDFRLLVWTTIGRLNTKGVEPFAEGLAILQRVVETQWETMFPPVARAKARANYANWLFGQMTTLIAAYEPTLAQGDVIRAIQAFCLELDSTFTDKLGDSYNGLGTLKGLLRSKVSAIPVPPPAVVAPPKPTPPATADSSANSFQTPGERSEASAKATNSPVAPPPAVTAQAPAPVTAPPPTVAIPTVPTISSVESITPALRVMADGICNAARVLRTADPGNAAAYRLHRQGLWLTVTEAPPAEDGRTRLRAPGADLRRQLEAKAQASHFMELIQQAEDLSNQYLFWLDLHRLIAIAMDRLGALFIEARGIVAREMVSLINRVPSIRTLAFMDGTPFADTATQAWLDETIASYGSGGESASVSKGSEEDDALEQRFAEARELVTQGKVAEGIGLAAQLAPRAADERGRFAGRLKIAEIALIGGKPEVSRPILEALMVEVDDRKLDTWEPQLCAPVISALVTTYRSLGAEIEKATIQSLQGRLCRLDPVAALKWAGT